MSESRWKHPGRPRGKPTHHRRTNHVTLQRCLFRRSQGQGTKNKNLRIVSYNILADSLLYKHLYLYVYTSHLPREKQPYYFKWEYRKELLLQQLFGPRPRSSVPRIFERLRFNDEQLVRPDIVCLQEVDMFDDLADSFRAENFSGLFKQRTGERLDGCALFYRKNKLELLANHNVEFNRSLPGCTGLLSDHLSAANAIMGNLHNQTPQRVSVEVSDDKKRIVCIKEPEDFPGMSYILDRDNIAMIALFRVLNDPGKIICIANTHLLFNPKRGDIKLAQIDLLLHEIMAFLGKNNLSCETTPLIVCGDFNSTSYSSIYHYMEQNSVTVDPGSPFWRRALSGLCNNKDPPISFVPSVEELEKNLNLGVEGDEQKVYHKYLQEREKYYFLSRRSDQEPEHFAHPFKFTSSYCINGKEPYCTSLHRKAQETVDYIWHTNLQHKQYLQISHLPSDELSKHVIPNRFHPSDHFMLASEFSL